MITTLDASAKISPSGLLPPEIENDPNISKPSEVLGGVALARTQTNCLVCNLSPYDRVESYDRFQTRHYLLENSGIIEYLLSRRRGERSAYSARPNRPRSLINITHLDEARGQVVYRRASADKSDELFTWQWNDVVTMYAGPEGVSTDSNATGRFSSPIIYFAPGSPRRWHSHSSPQPCVVYDSDSRRFYTIDFKRQIVRKGPEIEDSSVQPVDAGLLARTELFRPTQFYLPSTKSSSARLPVHVSKESGLSLPIPEDELKDIELMPIPKDDLKDGVYERILNDLLNNYSRLLIVNSSGRIDLLDLRKLTLTGPVGYLPRPRTLFGWDSSSPRHLMDYDVERISLVPAAAARDSRIKTGLIGLVAVSVSRQGMWTSVAVFDDKGNKIKSASSEAGLFDKPLNTMLTLTKYLFESLHPPALTLASFFTAYSFEARSSHRALFLMPNSFAAMVRDREGNMFFTLLIVLLVMLPGLALAGLLGCKVVKDASRLGLSLSARRCWLAATIAFGFAGYITYRLTRARVTLVTCANCGKPRRPDLETCHQCGGKWDVPELTPPAWRVLGGTE